MWDFGFGISPSPIPHPNNNIIGITGSPAFSKRPTPGAHKKTTPAPRPRAVHRPVRLPPPPDLNPHPPTSKLRGTGIPACHQAPGLRKLGLATPNDRQACLPPFCKAFKTKPSINPQPQPPRAQNRPDRANPHNPWPSQPFAKRSASQLQIPPAHHSPTARTSHQLLAFSLQQSAISNQQSKTSPPLAASARGGVQTHKNPNPTLCIQPLHHKIPPCPQRAIPPATPPAHPQPTPTQPPISPKQ